MQQVRRRFQPGAEGAADRPLQREKRGAMISRKLRKIFLGAVPPFWLLTLTLLSLAAYSSAPEVAVAQKKERAKPTPTVSAPDPCALLSNSDIRGLEGEGVVEKKYSEQGGTSFLLRTCFYRTATFAKSVSLALAVPNPGNRERGPREYWMKYFGDADSHDPPSRDAGTSERKGEEAERGPKAVEVSGLGEQAYWIPDPHVGTLYVLEENYFLRISLGGTNDHDLRSRTAKDLARAALKRLKRARARTSVRGPALASGQHVGGN